VKSVGTLRTPNSIGYDLRLALEEPGKDGGRRVLVVTDRPVGFNEATARPVSFDYPFTVIDMLIPPTGLRPGHDVDCRQDHPCRANGARRELRHPTRAIEPHRSEETHQTMKTRTPSSAIALSDSHTHNPGSPADRGDGRSRRLRPTNSPPRPLRRPAKSRIQPDRTCSLAPGTEATNGKRLSVHYTLWMYDPAGSNGKGQQVQTSVGGTPFSLRAGTGAVIAGWDRGVPAC
jgi:hypothetical protein